MTINIEGFKEFFNLYPSDVSNEEFDRALEIAKARYKNLLCEDFKDDNEVKKELIYNLILQELLKKYNYLTGENQQRFSINKVSEHIERLAWLVKSQRK